MERNNVEEETTLHPLQIAVVATNKVATDDVFISPPWSQSCPLVTVVGDIDEGGNNRQWLNLI